MQSAFAHNMLLKKLGRLCAERLVLGRRLPPLLSGLLPLRLPYSNTAHILASYPRRLPRTGSSHAGLEAPERHAQLGSSLRDFLALYWLNSLYRLFHNCQQWLVKKENMPFTLGQP